MRKFKIFGHRSRYCCQNYDAVLENGLSIPKVIRFDLQYPTKGGIGKNTISWYQIIMIEGLPG